MCAISSASIISILVFGIILGIGLAIGQAIASLFVRK
jgi:hypothetical protein